MATRDRIKSSDEIADEQAEQEAKYDARQAKAAAAAEEPTHEAKETEEAKEQGRQNVKDPDRQSPAEIAEAGATPTKPKSHIQEWWEGTPLGGALTALGEDLGVGKKDEAGKDVGTTKTKEGTDASGAAMPTEPPEGNEEPRRGGGRGLADQDAEAAAAAQAAQGASNPNLPAGAVPGTPGPGGVVQQVDQSGDTSKYYKGVEESMGENATEYLKKAQETAKGLAEEQAKASALGSARASLAAAKTSGLNAGESALSSGAQAGQTYGDVYGNQINQGINQYGQATGQFGLIAGQRAGEQLTVRGQDMSARTSSQALAAQTAEAQAQRQQQNTLGWLGFGANVLGALLSDEDAKKNIQPTTRPDVSTVLAKLRANKQPVAVQKTTVEQVLAKVRPVKFDYKGEGDGANRVGVIAQDIEKSPLKAAVIDTPQGKAIDTAQLTGGNTAMILELAQMVNDLRKELAQVKGNNNG